MAFSVTDENFDWFAAAWRDGAGNLPWDTFFVLPPWVRVWQQHFAPDADFRFAAVRQDSRLIGIAPLLVRDGTACLTGSADVCDFVDFIVARDAETDFSNALLDHLVSSGITALQMPSLRPDSIAQRWLLPVARQRNYQVSMVEDDISLERDLPATWEDYLMLLSTKQRHEVRRKLRRLDEAGEVSFRFIEDPAEIPPFMDTFLSFFVESRADKATFLTGQMDDFFRAMTLATSEAGLLRPAVLELDGVPVAAVIAFDYQDVVYLYNSGYDPEYRSLSVGIASKVLYIKDCIERGRKKFDFLKGDEHYKYQLGGEVVRLHDCRVTLG